MHSPEVLVFSIKSPFWRTMKFGNGKKHRVHDSIIDVWHMEPNGADSLTICRDRITDESGKFVRWSNAWKWHFWHYKISPSLLYKWRRYLFTRCAECGGPSRKGHMVNHSDGGFGGRPKTPLWCGEVHLYHSECLSKKTKEMQEQIHTHVKENCYFCVGPASFKINRNKANAIPEATPKMPQAQRDVIEELNVAVGLGLMSRQKALDTYNKQKKEVEWL